MTVDHGKPLASGHKERMARMALAALIAGAGLLAGCGGADTAADRPPPVGEPASTRVGTAGGELGFVASGVAGRLSIPAGALASDTLVTVTPLAPEAGEWARVRIDGPSGVLETPATLTLQLPAAPGPFAAGVRVEADGAWPLGSSTGADGRSLVLRVQAFGDGDVAAAASPAGRARALAAPLAAAPGASAPVVAGRREYTPQERLDALRLSIERHARERSLRSGLDANLSAAAAMQLVGGDNGALALREIEQATNKACNQLRIALLAARGAPVPFDLNVRDVNESQRWIFSIMAPVLYWQAVVMQLGGDPCADADVEGVLSARFTELLNWVKAKTAARQDSTGFGQVVKPVPQAATLASHALILQAPRLASLVTSRFVEPAMVPLRAIAWETTAATQAHYQLVISQLNNLYVGPFRDDVQMVRTSLQVSSAEGGQALASGSGGAGATPAQTVGEITVAARKGGQVTVSGPIDVLHCPNAANERLVIDFEGATVLDRPAVGTRLLDGTLGFSVDTLLAAAGISPTTRGTHLLRVRRVASSCNGALGLADAVLVRVRLDFEAGQAPPPSQIAGKTFTGTLVTYYAPFRHPDCSRSCLENNPGADRCRTTPDSEVSVTVTGEAREYTMTLHTRPASGAGAGGDWFARVFRGPGSAYAMGGGLVGPQGVVDPSLQTGGLALDVATGTATGTVYGKCTEEEFSAR